MNLLRRFWSGVVAAVAGAALALVVQIVGQMTLGWTNDDFTRVLTIGIGLGFIIGVLMPPRPAKPVK